MRIKGDFYYSCNNSTGHHSLGENKVCTTACIYVCEHIAKRGSNSRSQGYTVPDLWCLWACTSTHADKCECNASVRTGKKFPLFPFLFISSSQFSYLFQQLMCKSQRSTDVPIYSGLGNNLLVAMYACSYSAAAVSRRSYHPTLSVLRENARPQFGYTYSRYSTTRC